MSIKAMTWAFEQHLHPRDKFVLVTLANYANDKNLAWPSVKTVIKNTGLSRPSIFRALEKLEKLGVITRIKRYRKEGGGLTSSTIRMNVNVIIIQSTPLDENEVSDGDGGSLTGTLGGVYQGDGGSLTQIPLEPLLEPSVKNPTSASAKGDSPAGKKENSGEEFKEDFAMKKFGEEDVKEVLKPTLSSSAPTPNQIAHDAKKGTGGYSVPTLRKVWAGLYSHYKHGFLSEWTLKQQAQMKLIQKKLHPELDTVLVLTLVMSDWKEFCEETGWSKYPNAPTLQFLLLHADVAGNMLQKAQMKLIAKNIKPKVPPVKFMFPLPGAAKDLTKTTESKDNKTNDNPLEDE